MMEYRNIIVKSLSILALLSLMVFASAEKATRIDAVAKPIGKALKVQVFELLSMDCGVKGGIDHFKETLGKLDAGISSVFTQILEDGNAPKDIIRVAQERAKANYKTRQEWLTKESGDLFDKQTLKQLSNISLDDYVASSIRKLNVRYQTNAIMGLEFMGKPGAIKVIMKAAEKEPELAIIAKRAIQAITLRNNP